MAKITSLKLSILSIVSILLIIHWSPFFDQEFIQRFSQYYSNIFLSGFVLSCIIIRTKSIETKLDRLFWLLLCASFVSWLLLAISNLYYNQSSFVINQSLLSNICYFAYLAFMITAIEIKSYSNANKTLNFKSTITALSLFSFLIGSFTYFVLIPNSLFTVDISDFVKQRSSFHFFSLMNCYLILRWLHLGWQSGYRDGNHFFFFALASFSWFILHIIEFSQLSNLTNEYTAIGEWTKYLPYFLYFLGISKQTKQTEILDSRNSFSRYHFLNSPLFFLGLISVFFSIDNSTFIPIENNKLQQIQIVWIAVTIVLATLQILDLFKINKERREQLNQAKSLNESIVKQLEESTLELKQQTGTNQVLLDTIRNPIFTVRMNGEILATNAATSELLEYQEENLIGTNFRHLIPKNEELYFFFDYQGYQQKLQRSSKAIELDSQVISKKGQRISVHVTLSKSIRNRKTLLIISLADTRQQKEAEQKLLKLKDDFTANISHEFRTPLTIVSGIIDGLLHSSTDKANIKSLEVAKRSNLRLIHMVDQLLEVSRIDSESIIVSDIDVSKLIEPICQSYKTIAKDKGIDLSISLCDQVLISGNRSALENILYNLLSNAFKYTAINGSVNILLEETQFGYRLVVADTGVGIPKEELGRIFDRFQRVDLDSQNAIPGAGIGLSLVNDLINAMQWKITVESVVNKGSRFIVEMKKARSQAITKIVSVQEEPSQNQISFLQAELSHQDPSKVFTKSKYLVLIIEDNSDMRYHLDEIISKHHQCILASNGQQGLNMAEEFLPDIIISDVMMPGIDGFEVLNQIKSQSFTTHIPFILLTAKSDQKSKIRGLSDQADDYLTKPFDAQELLLKIGNQLRVRKKLQQKYEAQWHGFSNSTENEEGTPVNSFLIELNKLFEKNYRNVEFSMNQLADELSMSERQLQRKVKAMVDISPLELLKRFRLDKTKPELRKNLQIGLVAQSCGFSSQTYFGRCFKEHYGITPKAYQQQEN